MEKSKHTPAPWYPVNYGGYIHIQSTPYYEATDILDEDKCANAEANAQLASTAPELLAILRELVEDIQDEPISTGVNDTIRRANEIIDKALNL